MLLAPVWDDEWHNFDDERLEKGRSFLAAIFRGKPVADMDQQHGIAILGVYREMLRLPYRIMNVGTDLHLGLPGLAQTQGLASEAFEHALLFSSPEGAVEMLEKGRDVFWTQTLRLRSSFDDLPPDLAERLNIVTPKLESYIHMMYDTNWEEEGSRYEEELDVLRSTQKEFQSLAKEARQLEGHERFMTDPDPHFSSLAMAAQKGPVVILAARETSTDAIIIRSPTSGAERLVLGGISIKRLNDIFIQMKDYNTKSRESPVDTSYDSADEISRADRPSVRAGGDQLSNILWQEVVRPVIDALGYQIDESVHLTAALMFCGFRSVVATMWTTDDLDGPEVADAIYTEFFKGGIFNPDDIPYALDAAVQSMRSRGLPPSRWATYIHTGV
ncbi:hypothetical protein EW026_g147 [Hermanssonia centrifuga]|uniref:CHAT domain-containing protein n=1 Tax=Hermanssonia centrifuga TaxID=98765 RepID=A0A4S4KVL0_9APHY|nr:hypothetical protein EW026_g147 [Hermanssonia centrifuga]